MWDKPAIRSAKTSSKITGKTKSDQINSKTQGSLGRKTTKTGNHKDAELGNCLLSRAGCFKSLGERKEKNKRGKAKRPKDQKQKKQKKTKKRKKEDFSPYLPLLCFALFPFSFFFFFQF